MFTVASLPTWRNVRITFFAFLAVWSLFALSTLRLGEPSANAEVKSAIDEPRFQRTEIDDEMRLLPAKYLDDLPALKHNFRYILQPDLMDSCEDHVKNRKFASKQHVNDSGNARPLLLVMVHSSASHFKHRNVIRQTWAASAKLLSKIVFLLGNPQNETTQSEVSKESRLYGDILQEDFHETYRNITVKAIMGLKWAAQHCPAATYVIKCDDDMYVAIRKILHDVINQVLPSRRLLLCQPVKHGSVMREGKYGVSKELYPYRKWPEFCFGGCWIASRDVIRDLYLAAETTSQIYLDDVFVTGILRIKVGLKITRIPLTAKLFCHARGSPKRVLEFWRQFATGQNADVSRKMWDCVQ